MGDCPIIELKILNCGKMPIQIGELCHSLNIGKLYLPLYHGQENCVIRDGDVLNGPFSSSTFFYNWCNDVQCITRFDY